MMGTIAQVEREALMRRPFRVSEVPAYTRIMDADGQVVAHIATRMTAADGTTEGQPFLSPEKVKENATRIATALNRSGLFEMKK